MRVSDAPFGEPLTIVAVNVDPEHLLRASELGLRPGVAVHVIHGAGVGGRLIGVGTSRLALDADTAARIDVALENPR